MSNNLEYTVTVYKQDPANPKDEDGRDSYSAIAEYNRFPCITLSREYAKEYIRKLYDRFFSDNDIIVDVNDTEFCSVSDEEYDLLYTRLPGETAINTHIDRSRHTSTVFMIKIQNTDEIIIDTFKIVMSFRLCWYD